MRILFCCNATKSGGVGHLVRSISIAEAAQAAGWEVEFLGRIENQIGRDMFRHAGHTLNELTEDEHLPYLAESIGADIVHVDSYTLKDVLKRQLNARGIVLSSIEDGYYGRRPADFVIDPSPAAETTYRPFDGSRRLLRGTKAVPIRQEIIDDLKFRDGTRQTAPLFHVFVIMGGTDALDITETMANLWIKTGVPSVLHVLKSGRLSLDMHSIPSHVQVVVHEPSPYIFRLFREMDLVISAAGSTIWELAAMGIPMAIVNLADNQADNYEFATRNGFATGLGSIRDSTFAKTDAVSILKGLSTQPQRRRTLSEQSRRLIDGRGAERIVMGLEELMNGEGTKIRLATVDDASMLFDWRNEPGVREVSRSDEALVWDRHLGWLQESLVDPDRCLLMVDGPESPMGTVRFDRIGGGETWEVSLTLDPAHRGKGIAKSILDASELFVRSSRSVRAFIAEMRGSNVASQKLFLSAGYHDEAQIDPNVTREWIRLAKRL